MGAIESKHNLTTSYVKGEERVIDRDDILQTIPECLQHYATTIPNRDAIVFCSTVEPRYAISWKEMYDRSRSVAKSFVQMGVKPGDNVIIVTRSCPEYLYTVFGAMMAAASVVNLVFTYVDGSDFVSALNKIGSCAAIVLDPGPGESNWRILKSVLDEYSDSGSIRSSKVPFLKKLIFIRSPENEHVKTISDLLVEDHESIDLPTVDPDQVAMMFQTSGSTGIPKLVCHTHAHIVFFRNVLSCDAYGPEDIFFNDRPFSWMGGFWFGVLIGQTRITVSGFSPEPENKISFIIDIIESERCTVAGIFPAGIDELLRCQDELPDDWPLKTIMTGGQPITKSVAAGVGKICKYLGLAYGGTEFLAASCIVVEKQEDVVDYSSGALLSGVEAKIVAEDGTILPVNHVGEIYLRTPYFFKCYLNDPKKTEAVMTSDGWYKTDDFGRINEAGHIFVDGRVSDMIISGAMNVMPSILEAALKSCPGVDSACVVPVPDKLLYQTVCACVTIKPGNDVTEDQIRNYMGDIHSDKSGVFTVLPKYYIILDKFPEETNGKTSRKSLRKMAEKRFVK